MLPNARLRAKDTFLYVTENYIADLEKKIGRSANQGGGQPFNSQYSLIDHKKYSDVPL